MRVDGCADRCQRSRQRVEPGVNRAGAIPPDSASASAVAGPDTWRVDLGLCHRGRPSAIVKVWIPPPRIQRFARRPRTWRSGSRSSTIATWCARVHGRSWFSRATSRSSPRRRPRTTRWLRSSEPRPTWRSSTSTSPVLGRVGVDDHPYRVDDEAVAPPATGLDGEPHQDADVRARSIGTGAHAANSAMSSAWRPPIQASYFDKNGTAVSGIDGNPKE
jgi:hypothetical protein